MVYDQWSLKILEWAPPDENVRDNLRSVEFIRIYLNNNKVIKELHDTSALTEEEINTICDNPKIQIDLTKPENFEIVINGLMDLTEDQENLAMLFENYVHEVCTNDRNYYTFQRLKYDSINEISMPTATNSPNMVSF